MFWDLMYLCMGLIFFLFSFMSCIDIGIQISDGEKNCRPRWVEYYPKEWYLYECPTNEQMYNITHCFEYSTSYSSIYVHSISSKSTHYIFHQRQDTSRNMYQFNKPFSLLHTCDMIIHAWWSYQFWIASS